jgi:hypothetical protein
MKRKEGTWIHVENFTCVWNTEWGNAWMGDSNSISVSTIDTQRKALFLFNLKYLTTKLLRNIYMISSIRWNRHCGCHASRYHNRQRREQGGHAPSLLRHFLTTGAMVRAPVVLTVSPCINWTLQLMRIKPHSHFVPHEITRLQQFSQEQFNFPAKKEQFNSAWMFDLLEFTLGSSSFRSSQVVLLGVWTNIEMEREGLETDQ